MEKDSYWGMSLRDVSLMALGRLGSLCEKPGLMDIFYDFTQNPDLNRPPKPNQMTPLFCSRSFVYA